MYIHIIIAELRTYVYSSESELIITLRFLTGVSENHT